MHWEAETSKLGGAADAGPEFVGRRAGRAAPPADEEDDHPAFPGNRLSICVLGVAVKSAHTTFGDLVAGVVHVDGTWLIVAGADELIDAGTPNQVPEGVVAGPVDQQMGKIVRGSDYISSAIPAAGNPG